MIHSDDALGNEICHIESNFLRSGNICFPHKSRTHREFSMWDLFLNPNTNNLEQPPPPFKTNVNVKRKIMTSQIHMILNIYLFVNTNRLNS